MSFIIGDIERGLESIGHAIEQAFSYIASVILSALDYIYTKLKDFAIYVWDLLVSAINGFVNWLIANAISVFNGALSLLSNLFSSAYNSAIKFVNGITSWMHGYLLPHLTADVSVVIGSAFSSIMTYYSLRSLRNILMKHLPDMVDKYGLVKGSIRATGLALVAPAMVFLMEPLVQMFLNRYMTPPAQMPTPTVIPPSPAYATVGTLTATPTPTPTTIQTSGVTNVYGNVTGSVNIQVYNIPVSSNTAVNISVSGNISIS